MDSIDHTGKMKVITPFVGFQVDICKAFGFAIPVTGINKYSEIGNESAVKKESRMQ